MTPLAAGSPGILLEERKVNDVIGGAKAKLDLALDLGRRHWRVEKRVNVEDGYMGHWQGHGVSIDYGKLCRLRCGVYRADVRGASKIAPIYRSPIGPRFSRE